MTGRLWSHVHAFFQTGTPPLSAAERTRSAFGALLGIGLSGLALHAMPVDSRWLIPPVGASAVILFALSHTPLAQPWPVVGSYLLAALAALASAWAIPVPQLAAAVAVAGSIWLMARFNCIHPPSGALALFIVLGGPYSVDRMGLTFGLVVLNVAALLITAAFVNNLLLGRRYPYRPAPETANPHHTGEAEPLARIGLTHADLESAVRTLDTFMDVQESELVGLYNLAVDHAFGRHVGLTCGDIMSHNVVSVNFGTDLEEAWLQLRAHEIKALPVVDNFQRLLGMLTIPDFLRHIESGTATGLGRRLNELLQRTPGPTSAKPEVVGQIMTTGVYAATIDTPIAELVHHLAEKGLHHIPVLDGSRRVVGIVAQSDAIAALYKRIALSAA